MKACANCGYLLATCWDPNLEVPDDAKFDPDVLRKSAKDPVDPISTSRWRKTYIAGGTRSGSILTKTKLEDYTWGNTKEFRCQWGVFKPIVIDLTGDQEIVDIYPKVVAEIHETNRKSCPFHFEYHPGMSARAHVELRIEKLRDEAAQRHLDLLSTVERAHSKLMGDREHNLKKIAISLTALNIVIVAVEIARYFTGR